MAEPEAPAVDVVRIMKEIRQSIQDKRARGIYTDEEVEALAAVRLRAYAEGARIDDKLLERLLGESHDWNIHTDYLIRTTRTGLAARAADPGQEGRAAVRAPLHGPPAEPPGADQPVPRAPPARQHPRDGAPAAGAAGAEAPAGDAGARRARRAD